MSEIEEKRKLSSKEIDYVLSFLKPNMYIPLETSESIIQNIKNDTIKQLVNIEIYPHLIDELKNEMEKFYISTCISPGESVGIVMAESICEKQTQSNLNVFHKAGSSDKKPIVSKFSELLNATTKPKQPSYFIHFTKGNDSISSLRDTIGYSIVEINLKKITKEYYFYKDRKFEEWHDLYCSIFTNIKYNSCITLKIDMNIIFEFKLSLKKICELISKNYSDITCIYSPDCYETIDIYIDTNNITLPENFEDMVNKEELIEIYLEEVVHPILEYKIICGIPGISNIFFIKEDDKWFLETENIYEKIKKPKFKKNKIKPLDSSKKFKKLLAHPYVDTTKTISNNIWDIYYTFGIEATRQYMIDQFSQIMEGVNMCHIEILVSKMTQRGIISSISRYTVRNEDSGPFSKASFEETLDNFLEAGIYGTKEQITGISASIICAKKPLIGTGMSHLTMDLKKLIKIDEEEEFFEEE
jgi:DNA-directed RNA polymerase beta' subunit